MRSLRSRPVPFGLAYAKMFNPTVGTIVMALAVLACLGSLLGWQFTIAQTGKSAAEERMFPAFFAKVNAMGAPITGMIVLGVVQTLLALSTISPTLSEQFSALVNLAVVTNVIPYIVSLSALVRHDEDREGRRQRLHAQRGHRACSAMGYSVFALYASGKDAVMGGMLVLGVAYIIWGFIAPRFTCRPQLERLQAHLRRACPRRRTIMQVDDRSRRAASVRLRAPSLVLALSSASPTADGSDSRPHQGDGPSSSSAISPTRGRSRSRTSSGHARRLRGRRCASASSRSSRRELALAAADHRLGAGGRATSA